MSLWTHVVGCVYIETFTERKNIKHYVEKKLKDAPKITGSEEDVDVFVNPLSGYNVSSWKTDKKGDWLHYQTCVGVTLIGDLRDRQLEQTREEVINFLQYLQKVGFTIEYHSISIYDELSGETETLNYKEDWYEWKRKES